MNEATHLNNLRTAKLRIAVVIGHFKKDTVTIKNRI